MGVWHITGLGLNPGAITVLLSYIHLIIGSDFTRGLFLVIMRV